MPKYLNGGQGNSGERPDRRLGAQASVAVSGSPTPTVVTRFCLKGKSPADPWDSIQQFVRSTASIAWTSNRFAASAACRHRSNCSSDGEIYLSLRDVYQPTVEKIAPLVPQVSVFATCSFQGDSTDLR